MWSSTQRKAWRCHSVSQHRLISGYFFTKDETGYVTKDGEPIMPPGMREHLKDDLDKSFDF